MIVGPGGIWVIFSDIHANPEALCGAIKDATEQAARVGAKAQDVRYISLGDAVDYGPDPVQCFEWVEKHCAIKLRGNHDLEASRGLDDRIDLVQKKFWPVSLWTRLKLADTQREALQKWELPQTARLGDHAIALGHATLTETDDRQDANIKSQSLFQQLAATEARCGLVGHTHTQVMLFSDVTSPILPSDHLPSPTPMGWISFPLLLEWQGGENRSVILNPGGLGQPRSLPRQALIPCAPYLLLDTRGPEMFFKFRKASYAYELTIESLKTISLPHTLPKHGRSKNKNKLARKEIEDIRADLSMELQDLILALRTPALRQEV